MKIVMNMTDYVSNMINDKKKPVDISLSATISLVVKYYVNKGEYNPKKIEELVTTALSNFDFSPYTIQEYILITKIKKSIKVVLSQPEQARFKEYQSISLYKAEYDIIETVKSIREKKFLATCYFIARYNDSNGWVNINSSEIFKLANIKATSKIQNSIIFNLKQSGLLTMSKNGSNLNIKVELKPEGKEVMKITKFENIGNLYIGNLKEGYKNCICCTKPFKVGANSRNAKYCKKCKAEVYKENARISYCKKKTNRNSKF